MLEYLHWHAAIEICGLIIHIILAYCEGLCKLLLSSWCICLYLNLWTHVYSFHIILLELIWRRNLGANWKILAYNVVSFLVWRSNSLTILLFHWNRVVVIVNKRGVEVLFVIRLWYVEVVSWVSLFYRGLYSLEGLRI